MRLHLMDFGELTADQGWFVEGAGTSTLSNPTPETVRRKLKMMGVLIEHPEHGVILYEVGPAPNFRELWPELVFDIFPITAYTDENRLDKQLEKAGHTLQDVSAIIIGHMHLDHAGGLELFRGTDVPVYVHELELKYAFYAVATKQDFGAYLPHYIDPAFNWKAVHEPVFELFDGITLYHTPGHTPGLMAMKVDLKNAGPFVFTSDTFFFKENYQDERAPGWLIRDMSAWWASLRKIQNVVARSNAHVIFGHDPEVFAEYTQQDYYD
ncbi:MAG TPA: N-acyl homoserine lactonase family protein [Anaerolineae bacterium]|nr:N-acyl homoserine lactonase family protein [Anaerolineae bacterium]